MAHSDRKLMELQLIVIIMQVTITLIYKVSNNKLKKNRSQSMGMQTIGKHKTI
jgi:hypothetical protein